MLGKKYLTAVILIAVIFVCACGRIELYQNLSEEDANEMLVLLSENGIKPVKKRVVLQNETSYSIEVKEADLIKARSLLLRHNLPRKKELGLTGVYKDKGLIPTPDEQKARFLLALKGEIINSIERIPQVVDADVVLNVPIKSEFADAETQKTQRPTASVVVRIKPDTQGTESITEAKIQQFVANAVEGLNPRDVAVVISYLPQDENALRPGDVKTLPAQAPGLPPPQIAAASPPPSFSEELMGLKLDATSKGKLKVYLLVFFLLLLVLSTALIIVIIQGSRMRRKIASITGPAGTHPEIEGEIMDDGPPRLR